MSRIGKKEILIPEKTQVSVADGVVSVKGPLGELKRKYKPVVEIVVSPGKVKVNPLKENKEANALWGTYASHIINMIGGVNKKYEKKLLIEGVGYRAEMKGKDIVLSIGLSHPVPLAIPTGIECKVEKTEITISGIDKELVGQFAAVIRSKKKPEPYKGKGIRYSDEFVRRKEGKKAM